MTSSILTSNHSELCDDVHTLPTPHRLVVIDSSGYAGGQCIIPQSQAHLFLYQYAQEKHYHISSASFLGNFLLLLVLSNMV